MTDRPASRRVDGFRHGVHLPDRKAATRDQPIRRFPFPPFLILLLSQHAGKPALPLVREGQEVLRGQPVAQADGFVSAPIHAPASGVIAAVDRALDADGRMVPAIVIEPFPASTQGRVWGEPVDVDALGPEEIIAAIRDMGMVGLGGAAFPAHVKFSPSAGKRLDTLIVNGCECEPYLTADHRVMLEQSRQVVLGTQLILRATRAERAVIAIETNKRDAAAALTRASRGVADISVALVETKYPQGAEKMLTRALLGREIPAGGLPPDVGAMVSNVSTAAEIGTLLPAGQGLIERVITVTGLGVRRPGNYIVPVGTPLTFVLEQVELSDAAREVVFGGPMMGKGVTFLETPITKGVSGILVLAESEMSPERAALPCIRCGRCLETCPIHLNPALLGQLAAADELDAMANEHLFDCFECGCCSFVCPAHIPLVQRFRGAKRALRSREQAA